jgi:hypothetical protein
VLHPVAVVILKGKGGLYARCDCTSWNCIATTKKDGATTFTVVEPSESLWPYSQLQVNCTVTTLCLNIWGGSSSGNANL